MQQFKEIWAVDFEFAAPSGAASQVRCMVAHELRSGRKIRLWEDELAQLSAPPYAISSDALFIAYYASAEFGCHLSLGWDLPACVLDLFTEFRNLTNGLPTLCGGGLLGALAHFGLSSIDAAEKETMRELALRGGDYTAEERQALLGYCESDVAALARLLPVMLPKIDLSRALWRGNFMKAAAQMEFNGIPINLPMLARLRKHWAQIQDELIAEIDKDYGVYEGRTFKVARFSQ